MVAFGTITRAAAIQRTAKATRGSSNRAELEPYRQAISALIDDVDGNAGTLQLGEDDKALKERTRLRAAFMQVAKTRGLAFHKNNLTVKKDGTVLIFFVDPDAAAPRSTGPRKAKTENGTVEPAKANRQKVTAGGNDIEL